MKITIFPLSPLRGEGVPDSIFLNFQLCSDIFFDSKTVNTETAHFKKFKLEGTVGRRRPIFIALLYNCKYIN